MLVNIPYMEHMGHALPTGMIYHQNHRPQLEDVALLLLHASRTGTAAVGTTTFPRGRQANVAQRRKVRCAVCKQMCVHLDPPCQVPMRTTMNYQQW